MRFASSCGLRSLRIETLETRELLSAVPSTVGADSALQYTVTEAGDMVVPIHAQVGSTALEVILGVTTTIDSLEDAINGYLGSVPGWHLTGGVDTTPSYAGMIDGSIVIGANGILKSASVALTASADIGGAIEGYYGVSVLHVGVGAAVDLAANVTAMASYSIDTNAWTFGGSASLVGYVKGYASAMAWPLKGEVYIQGDFTAGAAISSDSGLASASVMVVGSVGANAQMKSLFGGWQTIASVSRSLGSWGYTATYDVGAWLQSQVNGVTAVNQAARVSAMVALTAQTEASSLDVNPSAVDDSLAVSDAATVDSGLAVTAAVEKTSILSVRASVQSVADDLAVALSVSGAATDASAAAASVHATALEQLSAGNPLADGYWNA